MNSAAQVNRLGGIILGFAALALVGWRATTWFTAPPSQSPTRSDTAEPAADGPDESTETPSVTVREASLASDRPATGPRLLPPLTRLAVDPFRPYPTPTPPPEPTLDPPPSVLAGNALHLEGLALGTGPPLAMVNGKVVGLGDVVAGARVTAVDRTGVTLDVSGYSLHLTLNTKLKSPGHQDK